MNYLQYLIKAVIFVMPFAVFSSCNNQKSEESIHSLLVYKDGALVKEEYFNGRVNTDIDNVQSVTKTIVTLLVDIAIKNGDLPSESASALDYFPSLGIAPSDKKHSITIRHLLDHTSGLAWDGYKEHQAYLTSDNPAQYVMNKPMAEEPGSVYNYNSGGTHLISIILSRATGMSTEAYCKKHFFDPLRISSYQWDKLEDGVNDGAGFGLSMRPSDLVKIGKLFLDNGSAAGEQLISAKGIEQMKDPASKSKTFWGLRKSTHGYGWYMAKANDDDVFYSMGYGAQFIMVVPAQDLVIVATHNHDTADGLDQQIDFLSGTFPELIKEYTL